MIANASLIAINIIIVIIIIIIILLSYCYHYYHDIFIHLSPSNDSNRIVNIISLNDDCPHHDHSHNKTIRNIKNSLHHKSYVISYQNY